jgi:hypothetical protein
MAEASMPAVTKVAIGVPTVMMELSFTTCLRRND